MVCGVVACVIRLLICSTGFVYFASYTYFTSTYWPWMPNAGRCAGEEFAAFSGCGILSSYLLLFISFYLATYKRAGRRAAIAAAANGDATAGLKYSRNPVGYLQANGNGNGHAKGNGVANGSAKKNGSVRSRKA